MHAGLLDVLHDRADHDVAAVADRVDVDLDRVLDEAVDQRVRRDRRGAHVVLVVADAHGAAAEHVARAHEHRVADALGRLDGAVGVVRDAPGRRLEAELAEQVAEALPVLGQVDRARAACRGCGTPAASRPSARRSGVCPPNCTTTPIGLLALDHREHVLERERLEVEAVGGVVVGRDGLRVAVDHHRRRSPAAGRRCTACTQQ